jgi:hypothetical protein
LTPEEEINRAELCRQFLENQYVKQALEDIREAIHQQWLKSPIKDVQHREQLWALGNAADKFQELLQAHIETGKLAAHSLDPKRSVWDLLR